MIKRVQFVRHIKTAADAFLGLVGEITINTTDKAVRVHDGATLGGVEQARKDVANVPAADGATDGKMTATQATNLSTRSNIFFKASLLEMDFSNPGIAVANVSEI